LCGVAWDSTPSNKGLLSGGNGATMEPHPHYTDPRLAELIAFITAESK